MENNQGLEQPLGIYPDELLVGSGTDLVNNIKKLQDTEKALFVQLQNGASTGSLTTAEQQKIVNGIMNVSDTRNSLYLELQNNQKSYQNSIGASSNILTQETDALEVVERELHRAETRIGLIREQRSNRLRLVEINRYYGDKYKHHTLILQYITAVFSLILILSYLYNQGFIPPFLFTTLFVVIGCVGLYYIIKEVWDAYTRDNMMYQQYDWSKIKGRPDESTDGTSQDNPWATSDADAPVCVGQACCQTGHTWVKDPINKCFKNSVLNSSPEILADFPDGVSAYSAPSDSSSQVPGASSNVLLQSASGQALNSALSAF